MGAAAPAPHPLLGEFPHGQCGVCTAGHHPSSCRLVPQGLGVTEIPTPEAGMIQLCEGTAVVTDVHVSPTMSPLAMLDRVTSLLLLRPFLPGAVPATQHTRGSCFAAQMGEC